MQAKLIFSFLFIFLTTSDSISQDAGSKKPMLSITIDDPNTEPSSIMAWFETDDAILNTLSKNNLQAALFVCGKRVDNADGKVLLEKWDSAGHMICNHSYSHHYFHSKKIPLEEFEKDMIVNDSLIKPYGNYTKLFRYPYLKEGNTSEKRDGFRRFLDSMGYGNGFVTIDASDWYISSRLNDTLKYDQNADKSPFRQFYLDHIFERASFYDSLALLLTGRHIKHTLLLHHNLINALFLEDLIMMFKEKGWEFVNANDAFSDDIGRTKPDILPAGESLIWALAKESVKYNDILRYPGEDADYEKEKLDFYIKRSVKP